MTNKCSECGGEGDCVSGPTALGRCHPLMFSIKCQYCGFGTALWINKSLAWDNWNLLNPSSKPQRRKCAKCGGEKSQVCSDRKNGSEYPYYVECNSCKTVSIFGETELEAIHQWNEMNSFSELVADANSRDCLKYNVSSDSVIKNQTPPPKAEIMGMRISNCATCCIPSTNNINMVVDYVSYGKVMHSLGCLSCGRQSSWQDTLPKAITAWNTECTCNWNGTSQAESPKPSPATDQPPIPRPTYDYGEQPDQPEQPEQPEQPQDDRDGLLEITGEWLQSVGFALTFAFGTDGEITQQKFKFFDRLFLHFSINDGQSSWIAVDHNLELHCRRDVRMLCKLLNIQLNAPLPTPEPTPTPGPVSTPEPTSLPEIATAVTSSDSGDKNTTITVSMDRDTCKMVREIRIEFNGP